MTPELKEACEVIAAYMGYCLNDSGDIWLHDNKANILIDHDASWDCSLDLLIPVWEKLDILDEITFNGPYPDGCYLASTTKLEFDYIGKTIQQVACLATAAAVRELKEGE